MAVRSSSAHSADKGTQTRTNTMSDHALMPDSESHLPVNCDIATVCTRSQVRWSVGHNSCHPPVPSRGRFPLFMSTRFADAKRIVSPVSMGVSRNDSAQQLPYVTLLFPPLLPGLPTGAEAVDAKEQRP